MKYSIVYIIFISLITTSCQRSLLIESSDNTMDIYEEFWNFANENFIFFEQKNINWDSVGDNSRSALQLDPSQETLYIAVENSIKQLKDRHSRAETTMGNIYGYDYTQGYNIYFDKSLINQNYLNGTVDTIDSIEYGMIQDEILYIRINKFSRYQRFAQIILDKAAELKLKSVIIDVRDNLGGDSNDVPSLLGHLIDEKILLGYYIEKAGSAKNDITAPLPVYTQPKSQMVDIPVKVLINRRSYSATSYFASMIGELPNVELIGQITGGGAGGNMSYQLSNSWIVAVSVSDYYNSKRISIEEGVEPDVYINNTKESLDQGIDLMLEKAIERINEI